MNEPSQIRKEQLVEIHKARDPWQGHLLLEHLHNNDVEAAFQGLPSVALDAKEFLQTGDRVVGIYVLEHDAATARELVKEFLAAETVETGSPEKPHPDKQRFAELRGAVRDERQTFDFLGWVGVVFLAALALLWAIWPVWLKTAAPAPLYRWTGVALLAVAAVFAGNWTNRNMRR